MAVLYYESELSHSGRRGQKWHRHKYGRWQRQAVYANGQPDPNAKERDSKESSSSSKKTASRSSSSGSDTLKKAGNTLNKFIVAHKKKAAAAKVERDKKDLQRRLAEATASPEGYEKFTKTASEAELKALKKRLAVYDSLKKSTPDYLKKKEEPAKDGNAITEAIKRGDSVEARKQLAKKIAGSDTDDNRNKKLAELKEKVAGGKRLTEEEMAYVDDYWYMDAAGNVDPDAGMKRVYDKLRSVSDSKDADNGQSTSKSKVKDKDAGSAGKLLSNIIGSKMHNQTDEKAFMQLFKISKPSFSTQVARDAKLQKKLIEATSSPKKLEAFKKAATNTELKALEERLRVMQKTEKAINDNHMSTDKKTAREQMTTEQLRDAVERAKYMNDLAQYDNKALADRADTILNIAKYGPAIAMAIDSGVTVTKSVLQAKYARDVVKNIKDGKSKTDNEARAKMTTAELKDAAERAKYMESLAQYDTKSQWSYKDLSSDAARVAMGAISDELGVIYKNWITASGNNGGNNGGNGKGNKQQQNPQQNKPNNGVDTNENKDKNEQ